MNIAIDPRTVVECGDATEAALDRVIVAIDRLADACEADPQGARELRHRLRDESLRLEWLALPVKVARHAR